MSWIADNDQVPMSIKCRIEIQYLNFQNLALMHSTEKKKFMLEEMLQNLIINLHSFLFVSMCYFKLYSIQIPHHLHRPRPVDGQLYRRKFSMKN